MGVTVPCGTVTVPCGTVTVPGGTVTVPCGTVTVPILIFPLDVLQLCVVRTYYPDHAVGRSVT